MSCNDLAAMIIGIPIGIGLGALLIWLWEKMS